MRRMLMRISGWHEHKSHTLSLNVWDWCHTYARAILRCAQVLMYETYAILMLVPSWGAHKSQCMRLMPFWDAHQYVYVQTIMEPANCTTLKVKSLLMKCMERTNCRRTIVRPHTRSLVYAAVSNRHSVKSQLIKSMERIYCRRTTDRFHTLGL